MRIAGQAPEFDGGSAKASESGARVTRTYDEVRVRGALASSVCWSVATQQDIDAFSGSYTLELRLTPTAAFASADCGVGAWAPSSGAGAGSDINEVDVTDDKSGSESDVPRMGVAFDGSDSDAIVLDTAPRAGAIASASFASALLCCLLLLMSCCACFFVRTRQVDSAAAVQRDAARSGADAFGVAASRAPPALQHISLLDADERDDGYTTFELLELANDDDDSDSDDKARRQRAAAANSFNATSSSPMLDVTNPFLGKIDIDLKYFSECTQINKLF